MTIPFTQYVLPGGRQREISIDRPNEIEEIANRFIKSGGRFEAECLLTGEISLTAVHTLAGEEQDVAIELCENGPGIKGAVDRLVQEAERAMLTEVE